MRPGSGVLHCVVEPSTVRLLAERFGDGRALFIPESTASADHIAEVVGIMATLALVDNFGGGTVYLPRLAPRRLTRSTAPDLDQVAKHTSDGWSARRIAQEYGCTTRAVYSKRARIRRTNGG